MVPPKGFDYVTATRGQIESLASDLVGVPLDRLTIDVDPERLRVPSSRSNKGIVGRVYESYFGIPGNNRSEADFPGAMIELKSVPILLEGSEARAKERVSVGINRPNGPPP